MIKRIVPPEENPMIKIRVSGDLILNGWDRQEIEAEAGSGSEPKITVENDQVMLQSGSDCTIFLPKQLQVRVEKVGGDAQIQGMDNQVFVERISGDLELRNSGSAQVDHVGGDATLQSIQGDLRVGRVSGELEGSSFQGKLEIDSIGGDCTLQILSNPVNIRNVSGDLTLEDTNEVNIDRVGGDFSIDQSHGNVAVRRVSGDLRGKGIYGQVTAEAIGGDAVLSDIQGGVRLNTSGDIRLGLSAPLSENCSLRSGGDIRCEISPDLEGDFDIASSAKDILVNITGQSQTVRAYKHHFTIGEGKIRLSLQAAGNVRLTTKGLEMIHGEVFPSSIKDDMLDLGNRIAREVSASTGIASARISADINQKVNERIQKAMEKAEARMQAASERLKERESRIREQKTTKVSTYNAVSPVPPVPPVPAVPPIQFGQVYDSSAEPVSDEERLIILRMVQDKKITIEQAEQLLEALDAHEGFSAE